MQLAREHQKDMSFQHLTGVPSFLSKNYDLLGRQILLFPVIEMGNKGGIMPRGGKVLYDLSKVNQVIRDKGFQIDPEFVWQGISKPISFICPQHGKTSSSNLNNFKNSQFGCKQCGIEDRSAKLKALNELNTDKVNQEIISKGFQIDPEFQWTGAHNTVSFICLRHGKVVMSNLGNFRLSPYGCPKCADENKRIVKSKNLGIEIRLTELLKKRNFALISQHAFLESTTQITVKCLKDSYEWETSYNRLTNHPCGCKRCSGVVQKTYEEFVLECENNNAVCLDPKPEHLNSFTLLRIKCKKCGRERQSSLQTSFRCYTCNPMNVSVGEKELAEFIGSFSETIRSDRTLIKPFEIDILIPDKRIGIEYSGIYFHNETRKDKNYHLMKFLAAKKAGYQLVTVWDWEWENRQTAVKSRLQSLLGANQIKIGARKTQLKIYNQNDSEVTNFLKEYHVQGSALFLFGFGLEYEGKLQAVMTFNRHHRQNTSKNYLVLNRYCVRGCVSIQGGASKLFQEAVKYIKSLGQYTTIVSYSDNRWSAGNLYAELGFILDTSSAGKQLMQPDYFYITESCRKIFSKQSLKKTEAEAKTNKTEHELRLAQGFLRVYDCGKQRWLLELK